jgi:uncharacterized protein (DUF1697 family)
MKRFIVLLRAVMPSGRNKVPMAQLREALSAGGFENVRTYIQSGNALLDTTLPAREVEQRVRALIKEHIGPDLAIVARTPDQVRTVLEGNPFQTGHDQSRVFFVLMATKPSPAKVKALLAEDFGEEKLAVVGTCAYLYVPGTYGRNRLSNNFVEKKLGVAATMRNLNTLTKLVEMSADQAPADPR